MLENNEASSKLTTANGGTFTWAQLDTVANHVTTRSIGDWRALTWLATATGWTRRKRSAICSGKLISLSVSTWFDTTWIEGTASRLYMCKSVHVTARPIYKQTVQTATNDRSNHGRRCRSRFAELIDQMIPLVVTISIGRRIHLCVHKCGSVWQLPMQVRTKGGGRTEGLCHAPQWPQIMVITDGNIA